MPGGPQSRAAREGLHPDAHEPLLKGQFPDGCDFVKRFRPDLANGGGDNDARRGTEVMHGSRKMHKEEFAHERIGAGDRSDATVLECLFVDRFERVRQMKRRKKRAS
jgi:hypothetical protein